MKKFILLQLTFIGLIAIVVYLFYIKPNQPIAVETETVKSQLLTKKVTANGTLVSQEQYKVFSPVTGVIKDNPIDNYKYVDQDEILLLIKSQTGLQEIETRVTAPISGTVFYTYSPQLQQVINLQKDMLVTQGQELLTINKLDQVEFNAQVAEADIAEVKVGYVAVLDFDTWPDTELNAEITELASQTTTNLSGEKTVTTKLKLVDQIPEPKILGISGTAVITSEQKSGITIPLNALEAQNGTDFVYLVQGSKATKRIVTVGEIYDNEIEILQGLSENDQVITEPIDKLSDGKNIEVK